MANLRPTNSHFRANSMQQEQTAKRIAGRFAPAPCWQTAELKRKRNVDRGHR